MAQDALDFFLHALGTLFRVRRIYPAGKKQVCQAAQNAAQRLASWGRAVRITFLGNDTIVEDRRMEVLPASFQPLFQTLRQLGCESIQIEANAGESDLAAWIEHVVSKVRSPYRSSTIATGSLNLERRTDSTPALTQAVSGYLGFLSQTQEALSDLESKKPEGLVRSREIVSAIASRLAVGKELFEPIHELKDFDDYTFTHALNVCVLSSALARAILVSQDLLNALSLAALCHDLGKREIPKEILNKKGPLEPEERTLMEKHPAYGVRFLMDTPGVESENPLLPVVAYQHHMGADQSGYPKFPESLSPCKLHFASLIVAVADVYDALRTVRPYRPALSVARACTVLIKDAKAGKLHKELVTSFLTLLNVLVPGRRVVLSSGGGGVILATRTGQVLTPIVEGEDGHVYDLSAPLAPSICELQEEAA